MVVHRGGTIKKGMLINVKRCRVAGSNVLVARAANLHHATDVQDIHVDSVQDTQCTVQYTCT